ncbi:ATP-dependent acyl-CoA ligase, partial [Corallococcus praedator]
KNIIRRSGENISALEVEQVLRRHPGIADVAVTSVNDAVRGEEVMACVLPALSAAKDAQAARRITEWALTQLAYYKAPGWVAFVAALPTTASQKLERGAVKQLAPTLLDTPACFDLRALKRRDAIVGLASEPPEIG